MFEANCIVGTSLSTKGESGGTTQLPVACSHEQTDVGGLPPAPGGQLPKEDRLAYNTFVSCISSIWTLDSTSHTSSESSQLLLWHRPAHHAWPKRNLRVRLLSLRLSMALLQIKQSAVGRYSLLTLPIYDASLAGVCLQSMSANFTEDVLFESAVVAEHDSFGGTLLMVDVSNICQLDAADKVCNLEEIVISGRNVSIDNDVLRKRLLNCAMNGIVNNNLPVVVIDLDHIEPLQLFKLLEQGEVHIALHSLFEGGSIAKHLFFVCQCKVAEGHLFCKNAESGEVSLPLLRVKDIVWMLPMGDGSKVECVAGEICIAKRLLKLLDVGLNPVCLYVKNKSEQVVLGASSDIAGFINEYGKLFHPFSPKYKKCRGKTPGSLTGPLSKVHCLYSTSRFRFASVDLTYEETRRSVSPYAHVLQRPFDIKKPRGIPSALGGPSIRGNQTVYNTYGFVNARFERSAA